MNANNDVAFKMISSCMQLMDSKQTLASLIGNIRDPQRVRSHRGQVGWWPPPDIVRRLSRCALGYVFSVILSLLLINWVLHWLPSTEQLAAQAGKDPGSMLLRIPRFAFLLFQAS